jgi:RHS repeat-associated protein
MWVAMAPYHLNYISFDANLGYMNGGFSEIMGTNYVKRTLDGIVIPADGYLIAYVSFERNTTHRAHFDDFRVTHKRSTVVQMDDYYPFGGTINSYSSGYKNNYLYQGKELQPETEIFDFEWRGYDPMLGRTWQIDPHAENYYSWSPYSWAFNNPINIIDPDGRDGVATIDKEKKTVQVSQTFHFSRANAEVLQRALSNLGDGSMTIDEFMADFNSNWGGESSTINIDGEEYSVGYSATFFCS